MVNPQPRTWMDMQKPRDFQFFILKEYIHHSVSRHLAPYFLETLSYKIEPPAYVAYVQFLPQCRYAAYAFFSNPCELQDLEFPFPLLGGDLRHVRLLHVVWMDRFGMTVGKSWAMTVAQGKSLGMHLKVPLG